MKRITFEVQADARPGAAGGYRNPTVVSTEVELASIPQLTLREIQILESPKHRINQTDLYRAASAKRDAILKLIRARYDGAERLKNGKTPPG